MYLLYLEIYTAEILDIIIATNDDKPGKWLVNDSQSELAYHISLFFELTNTMYARRFHRNYVSQNTDTFT